MEIQYITEKNLIKHIGEEIRLIRKGLEEITGELSFNSKGFDVISKKGRYKIKDADTLEIRNKDYMYLNPSKPR